MDNTLYREEILEHYRHPLHFGKLEDYTACSKQLNPFCGDEVEMFIKIENDTIADIGFIGKGCAISIASASILTEYIKDKTKQELTKFSQNDMLKLLQLEVSQTRKKCALLGFVVLQDCLK